MDSVESQRVGGRGSYKDAPQKQGIARAHKKCKIYNLELRDGNLMALELSPRDYTFEEFLRAIRLVKLPSYSRIKAVCYFTKYNSWGVGDPSLSTLFERNNILIENYGEIKKIKAYYYDRIRNDRVEVVFYGRLDPRAKVLFCITTAGIEAINRTLNKVARDSTGFYHLPIGSTTFEKMTDFLIQSDSNTKCTYFSASHSPWSEAHKN